MSRLEPASLLLALKIKSAYKCANEVIHLQCRATAKTPFTILPFLFRSAPRANLVEAANDSVSDTKCLSSLTNQSIPKRRTQGQVFFIGAYPTPSLSGALSRTSAMEIQKMVRINGGGDNTLVVAGREVVGTFFTYSRVTFYHRDLRTSLSRGNVYVEISSPC